MDNKKLIKMIKGKMYIQCKRVDQMMTFVKP